MSNHTIKKIWTKNRSTIVFIFLMVVFRSSVADWNTVPTGSMKPTIIEGDRILVDKTAYNIKLPLMNLSILETGTPQRGDIVVFDSNIADKRLVKRVVGLPGDEIQMVSNQLFINNKAVEYGLIARQDQLLQLTERLPQTEDHMIQVFQQGASNHSSFSLVKVPEDHYLVLGDNRDNSADSRYFGFVARDEIIGRARTVVMSLDYENYFLPRSERFFLSI